MAVGPADVHQDEPGGDARESRADGLDGRLATAVTPGPAAAYRTTGPSTHRGGASLLHDDEAGQSGG